MTVKMKISELINYFNIYRNPTPEITPELPVKWKPVRTEALEYLSIESPQEIKMSKDLFKERIQLWESFPCSAGLAPSDKLPHIKEEL